MRAVHEGLREALQMTRTALDDAADAEKAGRDLLVFCHGFCSALAGHHEGIAAIMESHFRFEERRLLAVLETLALTADPRDVLGPL